MASGATHLLHNLAVAGVTTGFAVLFNYPLEPVIYANIIGTIFTPDIDMEGKTTTEQLLANLLAKICCGFNATKKRINNVERVFAAILMSITAPYAFLFKHRSIFTHLPPISVIVQLFYFYGVYVLIYRLIGYDFITPLEIYNSYAFFLSLNSVIFFIVLNLQHFIHLIGDGGMVVLGSTKYYVFGKSLYNLSRKVFPQDKRD